MGCRAFDSQLNLTPSITRMRLVAQQPRSGRVAHSQSQQPRHRGTFGCQQQQHGMRLSGGDATDVAVRGQLSSRFRVEIELASSTCKDRLDVLITRAMCHYDNVRRLMLPLLMMLLTAAAVEGSWNLMMNESETRRILGR